VCARAESCYDCRRQLALRLRQLSSAAMEGKDAAATAVGDWTDQTKGC